MTGLRIPLRTRSWRIPIRPSRVFTSRMAMVGLESWNRERSAMDRVSGQSARASNFDAPDESSRGGVGRLELRFDHLGRQRLRPLAVRRPLGAARPVGWPLGGTRGCRRRRDGFRRYLGLLTLTLTLTLARAL